MIIKNLGPATLRLMNNHAIIATSAMPKVAFKSALAGRIQYFRWPYPINEMRSKRRNRSFVENLDEVRGVE